MPDKIHATAKSPFWHTGWKSALSGLSSGLSRLGRHPKPPRPTPKKEPAKGGWKNRPPNSLAFKALEGVGVGTALICIEGLRLMHLRFNHHLGHSVGTALICIEGLRLMIPCR